MFTIVKLSNFIKKHRFIEFILILAFIITLYITFIKFPFTEGVIYSNYLGDSSLYIIRHQNSILNFNGINFVYFIFTGIASYLFIKYVIASTKLDYSFKLILYVLFVSLMLFAPIRLRYMFEWPQFSNWGFLILFLLVFHKALYSKKISYFILSAAILGAAFYDAYYFGVILFLVSSPIFVLYMLWQIFFSRDWKKILYIFLSYSLSSLAFLSIGLIRLYKEVSYLNDKNIFSIGRSISDLWAYSARPWNYIIPDISNPFMGNFAVKMNYLIWDSKPFYLTEPFFPKEHSLYLGISLILLSLYAIYLAFIKKRGTSVSVTKQRGVKVAGMVGTFRSNHGVLENKTFSIVVFFLLIGLIAFFLSMPPYIGFAGIKFYLPSRLVYEFIPQLRVYARFGVVVFISNIAISFVGLAYIFNKIIIKENISGKSNLPCSNLTKYGIVFLLCVILVSEFALLPGKNQISVNSTPPYDWYLSLETDAKVLEIPPRTDYTDQLYLGDKRTNILNPFHRTPLEVQEIYSSLYTPDFAGDESLWCKDFQDLNGKYIFYHKKELNKSAVVEQFKKDGIVTNKLKVAMAESWGYPVFGNHIPKSESDIAKDKREEKMLQLLIEDPKFILIDTFTNEEIIESRPNQNFSADKFDVVYIFEINSNYCSIYTSD